MADDVETREPVEPTEPSEPDEVTEVTESDDVTEPAEVTVTGEPAGDEPSGEPRGDLVSLLEHEGEVAADYLEVLLDILDLDGDLDLDVEGERAVVAIVGAGLTDLVGPRGATLEALQELTRLAVVTKTGNRSRLMLDIGGYRAQRREQLAAQAREVATRVVESGESERLDPMSPFERKVVHDAVATVDGVHSESEGEEPQRRVVVLPD